MKVNFLFFLLVLLCVSGCSDEHILQPAEVLFFAGGDEVEAPGVTEIPIALQDMLWGNKDKLFASLAVAMDEDDTERASFLIRRIHLRDMQQEYYTKYIDAGGIAIIGNWDVHDWYFEAAKDIVLTMTSKYPRLREVLSPIYKHRFRWAQEFIEDGTMTGDRQILVFATQACAMAYVPEVRWGGASGGKCRGNYCISSVYNPSTGVRFAMDTFVHEFAHAIDGAMPLFEGPERIHQDFILQDRSDFDNRLARIYRVAHAQGIWKGRYADTNKSEYWAEGVKVWFYDIGPGREFETYVDFYERDLLLAALLDEWFPRVSFWQDY